MKMMRNSQKLKKSHTIKNLFLITKNNYSLLLKIKHQNIRETLDKHKEKTKTTN